MPSIGNQKEIGEMMIKDYLTPIYVKKMDTNPHIEMNLFLRYPYPKKPSIALQSLKLFLEGWHPILEDPLSSVRLNFLFSMHLTTEFHQHMQNI